MQTQIKHIKKLCLIAGSGDLPCEIANICTNNGIDLIIAVISKNYKKEILSTYNMQEFEFGQVGKIIDYMKENLVSHVVFAGSVNKPNLSKLKVDIIGAKLLLRFAKCKILGDDNMLSEIIKFLEGYGFKIISPQDITNEIIVSKGVLGKIKPKKIDLIDIATGKDILEKMSDLDIGQAIIIEEKYVIAVEAIEGTQELINRSKSLKRKNQAGVLIKSVKINQDRRIDLPTIGINTVEAIKAAGLNGIAVSAGNAIIIDKEQTIKKANELGVFIYGF